MNISDALAIVLELAEQNVIEVANIYDELYSERKRQLKAIRKVSQLFQVIK